MIQTVSGALKKFQDSVGIKFQLYNSLFLSLPFFGIDKTGILLSLFNGDCEEGYARAESPKEIIERFFDNHTTLTTDDDRIGLLFRFVQYAERQVVLFDALEDSAFGEFHDTNGAGTLKQLESAVIQNKKSVEFIEKLHNFVVRLVLTAHPTQFYPGTVLGIINDLVEAIADNDVSLINTYLQQLGRTPFFKKQKPTPFDEAQSLIWYLENVFYQAIGNLISDLKATFPNDKIRTDLIKMGFWSGGDRDGNPFVTFETTLKVANALRRSVLKCYYQDVRRLKRRLTFTGVDTMLADLESRLYENAFSRDQGSRITQAEILDLLKAIREMIVSKHDGLFVRLVDDLIDRVEIFGLYFAVLDVRQESGAHQNIIQNIVDCSTSLPKNYPSLSDDQKIAVLSTVTATVDAEQLSDELAADTIRNIGAIREIQRQNGSEACERYIISQCQSALNAIEVYGLFLLGGWRADELDIDIVPLFETITDLRNAAEIMGRLYAIPLYRRHLTRRGDTQTIMLGFSDGTKDGGYLMANWSIYKAKEELTKISKAHGISVIFFDGRGGPPARGGGKTHKFYSSMGDNIANDQIQLTVQGQTVSSNFGTVDAAQYNIEQLLHAGTYNQLFSPQTGTFTREEETLLETLAESSLRAYEDLKNDPLFLEYLSHVSPLRFYAETNIGSRPTKRGGSSKLTLKDLRAIPFVGAWSQLKQNVPGFYGVGAALAAIDDEGRLIDVASLYGHNAFFKALIDNCEMAMQKSFFPLTAYLADHPIYGGVWKKIHGEFELCKKYLALISGKTDLMSDFPVERQSVQTRERIVLPLTTIQQYSIAQIRGIEESDFDSKRRSVYEKLIMRCSFGIINAGRNSA